MHEKGAASRRAQPTVEIVAMLRVLLKQVGDLASGDHVFLLTFRELCESNKNKEPQTAKHFSCHCKLPVLIVMRECAGVPTAALEKI